MNSNQQRAHAVINSPEFKGLVRKRWAVSLLMTLIMLVIYIGFLLVVAFDKNLLAIKLGAYLPWAIPVGISVIFSAWVLTGIYVFWANNSYDNQVQDLKDKIHIS